MLENNNMHFKSSHSTQFLQPSLKRERSHVQPFTVMYSHLKSHPMKPRGENGICSSISQALKITPIMQSPCLTVLCSLLSSCKFWAAALSLKDKIPQQYLIAGSASSRLTRSVWVHGWFFLRAGASSLLAFLSVWCGSREPYLGHAGGAVSSSSDSSFWLRS